jgi:hypothetical protein
MKNRNLLESMKQKEAIEVKSCKGGDSSVDGPFAGARQLFNPAFDSFETYIENANLLLQKVR